MSVVEQGKKHQPYAYVEWEYLYIKIWRDIEHPMENVHYIDNIDILMVTKAWLITYKNIKLNPWDEPIVKIPLSEFKSWVYKVQARCNLHWTWEDEFVI